jgi:hypothetical protein
MDAAGPSYRAVPGFAERYQSPDEQDERADHQIRQSFNDYV